jgi:energy-coupling factor transporter ATP-binding protein EcfA2
MALSSDVRRLYNKWTANTGWPKRLDSLEINGVRGWAAQKIDFKFPIVAIVGENGAGKSTILQCAASVYQPPENAPNEERGYYPTDFFPDTRWDNLKGASIGYTVRQGTQSVTDGMKKLERWRGYSKRPRRHVNYIDLSRVQPIAERVGYFRLANPQLQEASASPWDENEFRPYPTSWAVCTRVPDSRSHQVTPSAAFQSSKRLVLKTRAFITGPVS